MTMDLRVKEDGVGKMVLRADEAQRKHEARKSHIADLKVRYATLEQQLREHGHGNVFEELEEKKRQKKEQWEARFREYEQKVGTGGCSVALTVPCSRIFQGHLIAPFVP